MCTSNDEKIRFIYEYFQSDRALGDKELKNVDSIPLMIRNNGLFNTLMFINNSKEYELFKEFYSKKIHKKSKKNLLLDIYNIYIKEDRLYIKYTREFYDLSCRLKSYVKTIKG